MVPFGQQLSPSATFRTCVFGFSLPKFLDHEFVYCQPGPRCFCNYPSQFKLAGATSRPPFAQYWFQHVSEKWSQSAHQTYRDVYTAIFSQFVGEFLTFLWNYDVRRRRDLPCWTSCSDVCVRVSCCAWMKGPCTTWAVALDLCDSVDV